MNRTCNLFAVTLFVAVSPTASAQTAPDEDRPTAVPSKSKDEMLKRFVAECVTIKLGTDGFPRKFEVGEASPGRNELPRKKATLQHSFQISKFETTQELYAAIMGTNPSRWKGPRNSVENVSWKDVQSFCTKLTEELRAKKLLGPKEIVRLPTAIEWEYCCRAGSKRRYCFGDEVGKGKSATGTLDEYAWHTGNAAGNDPAVGVLKANAWGLYDVHGYLWEFVATPDGEGTSADAKVAKAQRQIRGGSWRDPHDLLSSATFRMVLDPERNDATGFRCVIAKGEVAVDE